MLLAGFSSYNLLHCQPVGTFVTADWMASWPQNSSPVFQPIISLPSSAYRNPRHPNQANQPAPYCLGRALWLAGPDRAEVWRHCVWQSNGNRPCCYSMAVFQCITKALCSVPHQFKKCFSLAFKMDFKSSRAYVGHAFCTNYTLDVLKYFRNEVGHYTGHKEHIRTQPMNGIVAQPHHKAGHFIWHQYTAVPLLVYRLPRYRQTES